MKKKKSPKVKRGPGFVEGIKRGGVHHNQKRKKELSKEDLKKRIKDLEDQIAKIKRREQDPFDGFDNCGIWYT